ncbi:hypothetical protein ABZ619_43740 [Streptomyces sp. NPDC007851]|uniref:hypothetical protein n=1 Tax=Streptomyces sp. NPDC007851 TaxID=3155008 RepID=UPI003401BE76
MPSPAYAATSTVLYALPSASGSMSAPCSLVGAKSRVAALAPGMAADIDVCLRGGTYRLSQAFALGASDSGRNGVKVVYAAYEAFLTEKLSGLPAVLRLESHLTMKQIKTNEQ